MNLKFYNKKIKNKEIILYIIIMTCPFWWSHIVFALSVCLYTKLLLHQSQKYVLHIRQDIFQNFACLLMKRESHMSLQTFSLRIFHEKCVCALPSTFVIEIHHNFVCLLKIAYKPDKPINMSRQYEDLHIITAI